VSFYPGGAPKDYVSTVSVVEDGKTILEKEIRVNDPLNYKGVSIYQASYGKSANFLFNIGGENVTLQERSRYAKGDLLMMVARFEPDVHSYGPGVMVAYLDQGKPKTAWFLRNVARLKEQTIQGTVIRLDDIKEEFYTGLQVSRDPGIWMVWAGFAFILLGLYVNFFVDYRRIFVRKMADGLIVAGTAMRNKEGFGEEFQKLKGRCHGTAS
jgi:cytochrome c biogenesis protein